MRTHIDRQSSETSDLELINSYTDDELDIPNVATEYLNSTSNSRMSVGSRDTTVTKPGCILYNNLADTYMQYPESNECYLDGRYFNEVFRGYPGLCTEPLHVNISSHPICKDKMQNCVDAYMRECQVEDINSTLLIRVVTDMDNVVHHSSLLMIEPPVAGIRRGILFNSSEVSCVDPKQTQYTQYLAQVVYQAMAIKIPNLDLYPYNLQTNKLPTRCRMSGWCNAFIIMYAVSSLTGRCYDPANVKRYASMIECCYPLCPHSQPEVQYGGDSLEGAVLGGLAGLAIAGPEGAVLGLLGGYAVGSMFGGGNSGYNNNNYNNYNRQGNRQGNRQQNQNRPRQGGRGGGGNVAQ